MNCSKRSGAKCLKIHYNAQYGALLSAFLQLIGKSGVRGNGEHKGFFADRPC